MPSPLAALGNAWDEFADHVASWQAQLLRRAGREMADALDRAAMRDIEGAAEWRNLASQESRHASARS